MTVSVTGSIVAAVTLLVLLYFSHCVRLIRTNDPDRRLAQVRRWLQRDIAERSVSGRNFDWAYWIDEAERKHENLREHLRNYGTISLATGVGGTMGALALYLMTLNPQEAGPNADVVDSLLTEMGLALVASGAGVIGNLAILWGLLPWANRRFNPALDSFTKDLRKGIGDGGTVSTPPVISTQSVGALDGGPISDKLKQALTWAPEALETLGETAGALSEASSKLHQGVAQMTPLGVALTDAISELRSLSADLGTVWSTAIQSLSKEAHAARSDLRTWKAQQGTVIAEANSALADAMERAAALHSEASVDFGKAVRMVEASLKSLPELVAVAIEGSGEAIRRKIGDELEIHFADLRNGVADGLNEVSQWQGTIAEQLSEARRQHQHITGALVDINSDIVARVQDLPTRMAEAIDKISDGLGTEFGHQAQQHVAALRSAMREDARELTRNLQDHENSLLNTTVRDLRAVSQQLVDETTHELKGVSEKLAQVLHGFPEHIVAVNTRLANAENELLELVARSESAYSTLQLSHDRAADMVAGLDSSTEGLGKMVRLFAEVHAQAIGELAAAIDMRRRKPWWQRLRRRKEGHAPGDGARPTDQHAA